MQCSLGSPFTPNSPHIALLRHGIATLGLEWPRSDAIDGEIDRGSPQRLSATCLGPGEVDSHNFPLTMEVGGY
ncbi:hypothetical protein JTE90_010520 [Oedothorax gibbosus]|uniref:Uncharacterized protein n=1 Tax=Oedothorax gibbosus TaxID=931172 RepID=A0AAV6W6B4_9ARAC|nr:hypothetical protein JTE90_010520 [Oedothorax gibbosus]